MRFPPEFPPANAKIGPRSYFWTSGSLVSCGCLSQGISPANPCAVQSLLHQQPFGGRLGQCLLGVPSRTSRSRVVICQLLTRTCFWPPKQLAPQFRHLGVPWRGEASAKQESWESEQLGTWVHLGNANVTVPKVAFVSVKQSNSLPN